MAAYRLPSWLRVLASPGRSPDSFQENRDHLVAVGALLLNFQGELDLLTDPNGVYHLLAEHDHKVPSLPDLPTDSVVQVVAGGEFARVDPDGQTLAFEGFADFPDDRVVRGRV
jgi:hypothetical protein